MFVDDMTVASKSAAAIDQLMLELSQHFKLRDLGATTQLLGIKIDRDRSKRSITISQHQYYLDILERFGMADCKPISTPGLDLITLRSLHPLSACPPFKSC